MISFSVIWTSDVSDISHIVTRGMGIIKKNRKQAGLDPFNIILLWNSHKGTDPL